MKLILYQHFKKDLWRGRIYKQSFQVGEERRKGWDFKKNCPVLILLLHFHF
jgi:hypothetical protein